MGSDREGNNVVDESVVSLCVKGVSVSYSDLLHFSGETYLLESSVEDGLVAEQVLGKG